MQFWRRVVPLLAVAAVFACLSPARAADELAKDQQEVQAKPGQEPHSFRVELKLEYLLFLPEGYDKNQEQKWPLMVFLHGAGERGTDINMVKKHGPPKLVESTKKDMPFIV